VIKFNLLNEGFITNTSGIAQRAVNPQEVENLLAQSGSVLTFSGSNVRLLLDLNYQKSVYDLEYTFTPTSLSGLTIRYGRSLDSLTTAGPTITGNTVYVFPTLSGFSYPRYFEITHSASPGTPITLSGLTVLNNDTEVDFGISGATTSLTVLPQNGLAGYSSVSEVPVYNDGTMLTDMFITVDSQNLTSGVFNRLEISPTPTGTFQTVNSGLSVPTSVPWEWGLFQNNTSITSDNELYIKDPNLNFVTFTPGQEVDLSTNTSSLGNQCITCMNSAGEEVVAFTTTNNVIVFIDIRKNTIFSSSSPGAGLQVVGQGLAWNGGDRVYFQLNNEDRVVRYYNISTNTFTNLTTITGNFFNRASRGVALVGSDLYLMGLLSTSGNGNTSTGDIALKININTLVQTQLASLPFPNPAFGAIRFITVGTKIYGIFSSNGVIALYSYDTVLNGWTSLGNIPGANADQVGGLGYSSTSNKILIMRGADYIEYNIITGMFSTLITGINSKAGSIGVPDSTGFVYNNSIIYLNNNQGISSNDYGHGYYTITSPPDLILPFSISGSWISPVFKFDNGVNYHRALLSYEKTISGFLKADNSIGVDNFEIRGSDISPAADNFNENFSTALDPDAYSTFSVNGETTIASSGGNLIFSHNYINNNDTPNNRGYTYFSLPFDTAGTMQYKFWWNPSQSKTVGSDNWSAFYLAPFLDVINLGDLADRSTTTLRRTKDDNIYIRFGQSSDSNGSYTSLGFYNGSSVANYPIKAQSGSFYEVTFLVNWSTGSYSLYFAGVLLGSGTISLSRIILLQPQHSFEFYSASDGVDSEERFKYLTINRLNTQALNDNNSAIPVHINDPLFGLNGSLPWNRVTVNTALIPKAKYIQFRLTLRSNGLLTKPKVTGINFPIVLELKDVSPGTSKSIYVRYNFPTSNFSTTDLAYLRSWMATDKI